MEPITGIILAADVRSEQLKGRSKQIIVAIGFKVHGYGHEITCYSARETWTWREYLVFMQLLDALEHLDVCSRVICKSQEEYHQMKYGNGSIAGSTVCFAYKIPIRSNIPSRTNRQPGRCNPPLHPDQIHPISPVLPLVIRVDARNLVVRLE